jgi:hypothetical protein
VLADEGESVPQVLKLSQVGGDRQRAREGGADSLYVVFLSALVLTPR